jgi:hypothetical protein
MHRRRASHRVGANLRQLYAADIPGLHEIGGGVQIEVTTSELEGLTKPSSPINDDIDSGHVRTVVGGQEQGDACHFFRPAGRPNSVLPSM